MPSKVEKFTGRIFNFALGRVASQALAIVYHPALSGGVLMTEQLFLCGSLCHGLYHWDQIAQFVVERQPSQLIGSVYRLPVGQYVYHDQGRDLVQMDWVRLEGPPILFNIFESLYGLNIQDPEKALFFKQNLQTPEGLSGQVIMVNSARLPIGSRLVAGGDWRKDMQSDPPLTQRLSERQRRYISRLGSSKGRDIVPIDLAMYRELLKLGLIVDKGRRLALTRLGQDVFRQLPQAAGR